MHHTNTRGTGLWSIENNTKITMVQEYIVSYGINSVTGEMLTASNDHIRLYNMLDNSLIADFIIPQVVVQEQKKPMYKVKIIEPLILMSGWLIITTKKQAIFFSKYLISSKPIELKDQPETVIMSQREEDFYIVCADKRKLKSYYFDLSSELESVE